MCPSNEVEAATGSHPPALPECVIKLCSAGYMRHPMHRFNAEWSFGLMF